MRVSIVGLSGEEGGNSGARRVEVNHLIHRRLQLLLETPLLLGLLRSGIPVVALVQALDLSV